ncbi:unnamed protein product [Mytilus coruscus]|uniref:Uncharacterized protein n=1 Tax=Mytilus coruscus TaxID=42192 RepID=A0A6J8CJZ2_MYTCO|nr:unnamed protein product [Mytilus coruscus]
MCTEIPVGGASKIFSSKLENDNSRSVGTFNNKGRLQIEISSKTCMDRHQENNNILQKHRYIFGRNKFFISKGCYRKSEFSGISHRLLQYTISGAKEKLENETCDKFKTIKCTSKESPFQDGHNEQSHKSCETKRLGNFNRSEQCIFPCTNISETSSVHEVLHSKSMLSMESNVLQPNMCSSNFYKTGVSGSCISENSKYQNVSIFRRLVDSQSGPASISSGSPEMSQSVGFTRLYDKHRQIKPSSKSSDNIFRGSFSFRHGLSLSNNVKDREVTDITRKNAFRSEFGPRFFENFGNDGIMHRVDSQCSSVYETHSTSFVKFLEASQQKCSIDTTSEIPSFMVEKFSQHAGRPIFAIAENQCDHNDRCFNNRLWGSYGKTDFSGSLEFGTETFAHKLFGNESCNFDSSAFSENFEGKMCSDKERQHKRSTIHKSSRGDEVTKFMLLDLGAMADSNSKQYSLESSPHYGQEKCFSGSYESGKGLSDRMVSEQVYSAADFSDMGNPIDRFVCIMGKSPDKNILHLDSSSQCFGLGCSDNSLGEHVRVCVPPPPPICLIPRILQYMRQFHCQIILIASQWPRRHWYTEILQLLIACPIRLPVMDNLLSQAKMKIFHPNPEILNLTAWLLSTDVLKQRDFLNQQEHCSQLHGEMVQKRTIPQNLKSLIAGVVRDKLIHIQQI